MHEVTLSMSKLQASAVVQALDLYSRLCMGQIEEVVTLIRTGVIPVGGREQSDSRQVAEYEVSEEVASQVKDIKRVLGYSGYGNYGIGHKHVIVDGHRTWEIKKVLDKALAVAQNPKPGFEDVRYDGLVLRYTQDPVPEVWVG